MLLDISLIQSERIGTIKFIRKDSLQTDVVSLFFMSFCKFVKIPIFEYCGWSGGVVILQCQW